MTDLRIMSGDDEVINVTVTNPDSTPTNLTGATGITFLIKRSPTDLDVAAPPLPGALVTKNLGSGVTNGAPLTGVATITIDSADTAALAGVFFWELQLTSAAGKRRTVAAGRIRIARDLVTS